TMNYFKPERAAERRFTLISIEGDEISCTQAGNDVRGTLVVRTVGEQSFTCTKNKHQNVIAHLNFKADDTAEARRSIPIRASSRDVESERQSAINREVARISNDLESKMQVMMIEVKAEQEKIGTDLNQLSARKIEFLRTNAKYGERESGCKVKVAACPSGWENTGLVFPNTWSG